MESADLLDAVGVDAILRMLGQTTIVDPVAARIGTGHFRVTIWQACSGWEGIGLMSAFVAGYLWFCRRELRFPAALILLLRSRRAGSSWSAGARRHSAGLSGGRCEWPNRIRPHDASRVITAMNPSARQIYGYGDAEIVGRTFEILLPLKLREQVRRLHEQALGGEIVRRFPTVGIRSDGCEIAVAMTIVPVRGIDGVTTCVAFIATPMTDAALATSESSSRAVKQAVAARLAFPSNH